MVVKIIIFVVWLVFSVLLSLYLFSDFLDNILKNIGRWYKLTKEKGVKNSKISTEYRDVFKELLKEKEDKKAYLNSIKLLNKEEEYVKKLNEEIKDLLKV